MKLDLIVGITAALTASFPGHAGFPQPITAPVVKLAIE